MEEKMESEQSYSGDSSSSSDSCSASGSGSSEPDAELTEPVRLLGHSLELPQDLCENYSLFKEFFSYKTWEALEDKHKEHLMKHLPKFSQNEEEEKEKTIKMLFDYEPFHFTSPLEIFYNNLKQGNYRPDIAKMRKFLLKARAKQQKHKIKSYYAKLMPEVLLSRERLLVAAKAAPPGPTPRLPPLPPKPSSKNTYKPMYLRARQRYFEELAAIRGEVGGDESEDDNYPEGPPEPSHKKRKQMLTGQNMDSNVSGTLGGTESSHPTSLDCLKNVLAAHRTRRQYRENHPELNTTGLTLEDIKQRVALVNGTKKLMFGGQKSETPVQKLKRGPKKEQSHKQAKSDTKAVKKKDEESVETKPLLPNIKIKCEQEESDSESSFAEPMGGSKYPKRLGDNIDVKQEIVDPKYSDASNMNYNDSKSETVIKQEPLDPTLALQNAARMIQPVPIKLEDLDGIDMMALPVELADDSGELAGENDSEEPDTDEALTETTHANFLSLVRALFPARAAHRASKQQLHARCTSVMKSPIAPLNTWYSLSDDWCAELDSALDFLAGERGPHPDDFVPYLQYIPETQMYQWIGAGRDCDAILGRLCERWFRAVSPTPPTTEPPPPRYPTSWVVRPLTSAEIADFRAQERKRYATAAKPFTYVQHGYRSVVGPCARAGAGGAAGSLLAPQRPRHATLLALVRDAVARLPNGEGTRHDVLTLLKMSQWIAACSDQALLSALSTALDRLLSAKRDPVVKYDQRTAIWTYLHRNRSEEDWLKATARGRSKALAAPPVPAAPPAPPAPLAPLAPPAHPALPALPAHPAPRELRPLTPPAAMELEVGSVEEVVDNVSDSDVDVDDSRAPAAPPAPLLSSAQLLMRATLAQPQPKQKPKPAPKPKQLKTPKQVKPPKINLPKTPQPKPAVTPAKPVQKVAQPKAALMAQSAKQASLVAQAVKSNLIAQAAKQANLNTQPAKPIAKTAPKPVNVVKQVQKPTVSPVSQPAKQLPVKQIVLAPSPKPANPVVKQVPQVAQVPKSSPSVVPPPQSSPLIRQRPLQKVEAPQAAVSAAIIVSQSTAPVVSVVQPVSSITLHPGQTKQVNQGTRSLLIRPPAVQTTVTAAVSTPISQAPATSRRGVVRVLSPATPASGKSLISPRALLQQATPTPAAAKKRASVPNTSSITTLAQAGGNVTTVCSAATPVTRTVQLAGGRTVQLAANQTVHLPTGQAVQLAARTLNLSSLLPTKPVPTNTVQLTGQTVQIASPNVHLAGQSVQLTGHTVKLPGGQSVQVAGQSVLPPQTVQLPSGQTVQLAGRNLQTVQLNQNVLSSGNVMPNVLGPQTVQIAGQTVQLAGQTVQLSGGQTLQLPSGQTVQLSSGQTLQLASGQAVQLANQTPKSIAQVVRSQAADKPAQPIVAKLLTNAQGQMISLESMMGARVLNAGAGVAGVAGVARGRGAVRVLAPPRLARPLLLTAAKPLHNIILQQSDGTAIRVTSGGAASTSQTIVLSNIGSQAVTTSTATAPVLKLQQVNPIQQVKLPQGIKIQQAGAAASGASGGGAGVAGGAGGAGGAVRSVLMDGQQLKLVGGRHVLARLLRPAHPPQ